MCKNGHKEKLPVFLPEYKYIVNIERKLQYQQVSRETAQMLNIPLKKCRNIMKKEAPGFILDYDNLHYWNGEVPDCISNAFGEKIIHISIMAGNNMSIDEIKKTICDSQLDKGF